MADRIAKRLRANPTEAEKRVWRLLYPFRTSGFHFRKQVRIGPYVTDFACHHARVVIEVDGGQHWTDDGINRDRVRDAFLTTRGYSVLRLSNHDVLTNAEGVFCQLALELEQRQPSDRPKRPI